jgi:sarcosine oxidase / L-pipecolate oxidase
MPSVIVVGSGIFGVAAAKELRRRRYEVTLLDPGPRKRELAASTDISKMVRLDYGDDELYTGFMERALERWRSSSLSPFFHETGVLFLTRSSLAARGFEHDSYELLTRRGHPLERLDRAAIKKRFPAWSLDSFEGYRNPSGGWAESGNVVSQVAREAEDAGARIVSGAVAARLVETDSRVTGVVIESGEALYADFVVVAAGSWTPHLLPFTKDLFRTVGQPVFHLASPDASRFGADRFPVFGADIARTGYYGFPQTKDGVLKVANHGVGRVMHPEAPERVVTADEEARLRAFLREWIGELADAPLVATRVCVYCDTLDEHFWIAPDPERRGLIVAAGGSGHAFKFAPLLGEWIGDAVEGKVIERFRWRKAGGTQGQERARHHG